MKCLLYPALLLLFVGSCKKKGEKQFSTWQVNGESYSSNDVTAEVGKAITILGSSDPANRFDLRFHFVGLPKSGSYQLSHSYIQDPDSVELFIYQDGKSYFPAFSNHSALEAASVNDKARYTLSTCWFINYNDYSDSVRVSGTFNEP